MSCRLSRLRPRASSRHRQGCQAAPPRHSSRDRRKPTNPVVSLTVSLPIPCWLAGSITSSGTAPHSSLHVAGVGHVMSGRKIVSRGRALVKLVAGVLIAIGIAAWSAPSDARRHVFGHNLHPVRHGLHSFRAGLHPFRQGLHPFRPGLHSFRQGVHLPSLQSSHPCSVLGHRPCVPYGTYCSIFSHHPCLPDIDYPIGQTLQLTIESRADSDTPDAPAERNTAGHLPRDLNTIRDVFSALRTCWVPPEKDVARSGTQITLRLSFNSHGGIIAEPRTTYVSPDTPPDVRQVYWDAATAALKRCTPLQFTDGLGGALAGRPFAIRFVDDRSF
jgi:hypothetical protein